MRSESQRIVLASGNPDKLRELRQLFSGTAYDLVPQSRLGVMDVEETGCSFVENALLKARHAASETGWPAIADDSGLEVDALNGAPGIRSARFAGEHASDAENIEKLLGALDDVPPAGRTARFVCVVAYVEAAGAAPKICEGVWPGHVAEAPRGKGGFGYDSVFIVADTGRTAAELDADTKNRLSHRGRALRGILDMLTTSDESAL